MPWTDAEIQETLAEVERRARGDSEFQALALRDARAAIAVVSTKPIPPRFGIRFAVDATGRLTVVPPDESSDGLLNEDELELISGGKGGGGGGGGLPTFQPNKDGFGTISGP